MMIIQVTIHISYTLQSVLWDNGRKSVQYHIVCKTFDIFHIRFFSLNSLNYCQPLLEWEYICNDQGWFWVYIFYTIGHGSHQNNHWDRNEDTRQYRNWNIDLIYKYLLLFYSEHGIIDDNCYMVDVLCDIFCFFHCYKALVLVHIAHIELFELWVLDLYT